jgi:two-component system, NarL family, invasion response regulator UvrY
MTNPDSISTTSPAPAPARQLRILIADDHAVVRDGLRQLLADKYTNAIFGEAANTQQALDALDNADWDVMLLDLTMPGRGGLDVLGQARNIQPRTKILVLTMHPADQYAVRVLKAGAAGYLTKESASDEVVAAIEKALAGGTYVTAALAEKLISSMSAPEKKLHEQLSDREFQVLRMIAAGKSVKEMGAELALSVKTISTYRTRVFEKLKFKSNADAVRYVSAEHLLD